LRLDERRSRLVIGGRRLRFNREVQLAPSAATPGALAAAATFRGYCGADEIGDVQAQLVVCYGRPAPARLKGFDRAKALQAAGAAGMLLIAAPGLPGEPIRWPFAYSRSVMPLEEAAKVKVGAPFVQGVLNPDALARLTARAGEILKAGAAGADLPRMELGTLLRGRAKWRRRWRRCIQGEHGRRDCSHGAAVQGQCTVEVFESLGQRPFLLAIYRDPARVEQFVRH